MKNYNFSIKKSNAGLAVLASVGLHYLFNPSESGGSIMAILVRLIFGSVLFLMAFFITMPKNRSAKLGYVFAFICIWFVLNNFPENTAELFLVFLFLGFGFVISAYLISESGAGMFSQGLDFLLAFWVTSLFLQVFLYFLTSEVLDFHKWMHPLSEARIAGVGQFVRFTGVLIEPGTYANWVYGLVILRGVSGNKLFDRLSLVSILSILITLSAWGFIAVAVYLLAYFGRNLTYGGSKVYRRVMIGAFLIIAVFSIIYVQFLSQISEIIEYLTSRSELSDGSGAAKVQAYDGFLNIFTRIFVFGQPVNFDFCNGCLSPQDAGLFVNLAVRTSILFALIVFFVIFKSVFRRYGFIACFCIFPLAFAKFFYYEPLFWAILGCCFIDVINNVGVQGNKNTVSASYRTN